MLTFAIGDIHGCYTKLLKLTKQCADYSGGEPYRLVFLGDYLDRGPASRSVLEFVIDLEANKPKGSVVCLPGNHEQLLVKSFHDPIAKVQWLANGGGKTLANYTDFAGLDLLMSHADWIAALPFYFDDGKRFFVHAGVDPSRPLTVQSEQDMLWIREPFLNFDGKLERLIVHGHTPVETGPDVRSNRVNIDTGAVFGRPLTAAIFQDEHAMPVGFLAA